MFVSHGTSQRNSEGVKLYSTALLWNKPFNNQSHLAMAAQAPCPFCDGVVPLEHQPGHYQHHVSGALASFPRLPVAVGGRATFAFTISKPGLV